MIYFGMPKDRLVFVVSASNIELTTSNRERIYLSWSKQLMLKLIKKLK
jgi:hypothetical protein